MIGRLRGAIERTLPDGCPFVIGGGMIRDALYGGCPSDIDIWIPSNIHVPDVDAFCAHMVRSGYGPAEGFQGQVIFRGPGASVTEVEEGDWTATEADAENYGDVHNHWVLEIVNTSETRAHPRINIMRNMARWTGDAPSFFTEIMRNFDLDLCMFFVGMMPGQNTVNTVIMPQHMVSSPSFLGNRNNHDVAPTRMNEVYWNQARLETTSLERIMGRVDKMNNKYTVNIPRDVERIPMIRTEDIVAVPVALRSIISAFNSNDGWGRTARPTQRNRVTPERYEELWAQAQLRYEQWRNSNIRMGMPISPGITPLAFLRISA